MPLQELDCMKIITSNWLHFEIKNISPMFHFYTPENETLG